MRYRNLAGIDIPVIGFGCAPLGNEFGGIDVPEMERAIHLSIDRGLNFFDTSPYYGRTLSEERLGAALLGKRDRVVLSSKCGRYDSAAFDFSAARVRQSIDESLLRLQTDYLDLFIAHDIEFGDREQIVHETIPAMRDLQRAGKVKRVGISGLPLKILADVAVRGQVDFVLSYCHYNPLSQDMDEVLTPVLEQHGIGLLNASPVHLRLLTLAGPLPSHPAAPPVKHAAAQVVQLCQSHGIDPAIFALAFSLQNECAASTLVGMSNARELEANLTALDLHLDPDLLAAVAQVVKPAKNMSWPSGRPENQDA